MMTDPSDNFDTISINYSPLKIPGFSGDFLEGDFLEGDDIDDIIDDMEMELSDIYLYEIDFDKVKTLEDVINILKGMDIGFSENYLGDHPELIKYIKRIDEDGKSD